MLKADQVEELIGFIGELDRPALIKQFQTYRASFPLDFTDSFLQSLTTERLRHIFLAVCLQSQQMPAMSAA
jgi:hypothetical protein